MRLDGMTRVLQKNYLMKKIVAGIGIALGLALGLGAQPVNENAAAYLAPGDSDC